MKKYLLVFHLVTLIVFFSDAGVACSSENIAIDQETSTLIAPEGISYEWYLNGVRIDDIGPELEICESGNYVVKTLMMDGEQRISEITVNVDADGTVYRIWTIGDSTMQTYTAGWYPRMGWGQVFQAFFDTTHVEVINKGAGGTSSKSFYEIAELWPAIVSQLQPNDFVLIQFGINDRYKSDPARYSDPTAPTSQVGSYKYNLKRYVDESIAKGAYPILVSTIRRNEWSGTTNVDGYGAYAQAARDLAKEIDVPILDVDSLGKIAMHEVGQDYATQFWYVKDDIIHIQEMGAIKCAELAIEGMKLNSDDPTIANLLPHLRPTYSINVTTNYPEDVLVTQTEQIPSGLTFTLNAFYDDQALVWVGWHDGENNRVSYDLPYYLKVGDQNYSFEARMDNDFSKLDCSGVYEGGAFIDGCGDCAAGQTGINACSTGFDEALTYQFRLVHSDMCMTPDNYVEQHPCTGSKNQVWMLEAASEGHYYIKNVDLGTYLVSSGSVTVMGATGTEWRIEPDGEFYRLIAKGNLNANLAVSGKSTFEGVRISTISRTSSSAAHLFQIEPKTILSIGNEGLRVYPNPVNAGELVLNIDNQIGTVKVELFSLNGNKLISEVVMTGVGELSLEKLTSGIYVFKVYQKNEVLFQEKIIVP
ncbi:GDSL-type esterase/lipase family protein [Marinoscillum sp. MHG1-6]|uniref:GDSL-type esterase/lipase family protein n=1 Tax=Marinoscillum sp. MHG1-6 TaxID=2959627 RepID=UPI002157FA3D|nr:GDSL-type esterase/lipase family protein [Marinoscillum sp. MHG1-6]